MRGHFGGLSRVLLGAVDSTTGAVLGSATTLANGGSSGMYVASQARVANFNYESPVQLEQQGGDKIGNILSFSTSRLGAFDITIDEVDTALQTLIEESTPNTDNSEYIWVAGNPNRTRPITLWVAVMRGGSDTLGNQKYETIFSKCQVTFRRSGGTFRGEGLTTLNCVPQRFSTAHTGQAVGSGGLNFNLTDDLTDNYAIYSSYPIHVYTLRSDGTDTTFTSIYKPISTTVTLNATPNHFVLNATPTAFTSFTLAGAITLAEE
jgi:hypothetical protein